MNDRTGSLVRARALIAAYGEYADNSLWEDDPSGPCDGFSEFIRRVSSGRSGTDVNGQRCTYAVLYRNADTRYGTTFVHPCGSVAEHYDRPLSFGCDIGYKDGCPGWNYDDWRPVWVRDGANLVLRALITAPGDHENEVVQSMPNRTECDSYAHSWAFMVTSGPAQLTIDAHVADLSMHFARMALDYHRSKRLGCASHYKAAQVLARFALAPMVNRAAAYVHEFGHTYIGGHCDGETCFDKAARAFGVAITGVLGVNPGGGHPYYPPGRPLQKAGTAGWSSGGGCFYGYRKYIGPLYMEPGPPGRICLTRTYETESLAAKNLALHCPPFEEDQPTDGVIMLENPFGTELYSDPGDLITAEPWGLLEWRELIWRPDA